MGMQTTEVLDLVDYRGATIRDRQGNKIEINQPYIAKFPLSGEFLHIQPPIVLVTQIEKKARCFYLKLSTPEGKESAFGDVYGPAQPKYASVAAQSLEKATQEEIQNAIDQLRNKIGRLEEWLKLINS